MQFRHFETGRAIISAIMVCGGRIADLWGSVASRGYHVRTIATRPRDAPGRLPGILFVPWLSCDPVEGPEPGGDGFLSMSGNRRASTRSVLVLLEGCCVRYGGNILR
jgi:hypothetical protein